MYISAPKVFLYLVTVLHIREYVYIYIKVSPVPWLCHHWRLSSSKGRWQGCVAGSAKDWSRNVAREASWTATFCSSALASPAGNSKWMWLIYIYKYIGRIKRHLNSRDWIIHAPISLTAQFYISEEDIIVYLYTRLVTDGYIYVISLLYGSFLFRLFQWRRYGLYYIIDYIPDNGFS